MAAMSSSINTGCETGFEIMIRRHPITFGRIPLAAMEAAFLKFVLWIHVEQPEGFT
jgi:hypothetical protein